MPAGWSGFQDTARWVAMVSAQESERADALFRDPFVRKLAGPGAIDLLQRLSGTWPIVALTHLIDRLALTRSAMVPTRS